MLFEILMAFFVLVFFVNIYLGWDDNYWLKRGVPYVERGHKIYGNIREIIFMKRTIAEVYADIYKKSEKKPIVGFFKVRNPILMVRSPLAVNQVLVEDFDKFHDNNFMVMKEIHPVLKMNPFLARGKTWAATRLMMSSCEKPEKLSALVNLVRPVCRDMVAYIHEQSPLPVEAKDLCGRYTTDVIGSCAFGLEINSFVEPQSQFRSMTKTLFRPKLLNNLALLCAFYAPWLASILKFRIIDKMVGDYFIGVVGQMCDYREKEGIKRADFLQDIIDINRESVEVGEGKVYSVEKIAGHCLSYLVDGYYTSAGALCFCLYELAANPECQRAALAEIRAVDRRLEEYDSENIHQLIYLDMVIKETLRLHPPVGTVTRVCCEDAELKTEDGTVYQVSKGTPVTVPILGLHTDPVHFEEPLEFRPQRFAQQADRPPPGVYLPYGEGKRICPAQSFSQLTLKMALVSILMNFEVGLREPSRPLQLDPRQSFFSTLKGDLWLTFKSVQQF